MVIYNWKSSGYQFSSSQAISPSDIFELEVTWQIALSAVERGFVQLISDGPDTNPPPSPEEILDFHMTASSLDGSKIFCWNKSDLPIQFIRPHPWSEAFHTNLQLANNSLFLDSNPLSADGYSFRQTDAGHIEITLPDNTVYAVGGRWV